MILPSWAGVAVAAVALLFGRHAHAHMEMSQPYPINSQLNPLVPEALKDYSYTSPLLADGSNFPCKGYQNQRPILRTANYTAGKTYTFEVAGTATHDGGSCQLSLSYDNGKTFRVIKSMIGGCPLVSSYDFTIPSYAPAGTALLGWTWMNEVGNREYYMNCAWVDIASSVRSSTKDDDGSGHSGPLSGPNYGNHHGNGNSKDDTSSGAGDNNGSSKSHRQRRSHHRKGKGNGRSSKTGAGGPRQDLQRREQFTSFDQLPFIWKANLPPENSCVTVEPIDPVFTHPGPDVVYGNGLSASSPPSQDNGCDTAGPPGPAYKDLPIGPFGAFAGEGGSESGGGAESSSTPVVVSTTLPTTTTTTSSSTPLASTTLTTAVSPTLPSASSPTLSSIPSPTLPSASSPTLPSYPSPTLPSMPSPTLPGMPTTNPDSTSIRHSKCDSSIPGQGLKCLRHGMGFAICDHDAWVDMGSVAYGTKCQGAPGSAIIVAAGW